MPSDWLRRVLYTLCLGINNGSKYFGLPLCRILYTSMTVLKTEQYLIGNQCNWSDVWILGGIGHNSGKTVLNTQFYSRATSEQRVTVIKTTSYQSIGSHKSSFMCHMSLDSLKIPDMTKTSLADLYNMRMKIWIKLDTTVPNCIYCWYKITTYIDWEGAIKFFMLRLRAKHNEFGLIRI